MSRTLLKRFWCFADARVVDPVAMGTPTSSAVEPRAGLRVRAAAGRGEVGSNCLRA